MIRPSEMREIIEGLVESSDLETVKFCLEIYPRKFVLCLTGAFAHVLNEGNEEMIKLLVEYKVDYTTLENCCIPAIHSALTAKRLDILEKLFELGATLDKYRVWNYLSLRQAMRYKDKTFLSLLLEKGIPVNSSNRIGNTVLGDAIALVTQEAVEILLKAGATANGPLEIFELLVIEDYYHAKKLGMPISSQQWLLERAASAPYIDYLESVPVNSRSRDGRYTIETAILQEIDHTLRLLLNKGADVNIPTRSGDGLLHIAAEFETNGSVKLLLEKIKTLIHAGAILYPLGELLQYVYPDKIPRLAISLIIPLLARHT
ncbi:hypothetical protein TSAR_008112 [Trichomalopsis sarcophagae]|uniref:Uncharacterized protein n=1 Tax=Trichomalopsis sarcophagae TaxID=543379 RepID=A0A232EUD7_9HYME|nr:hypothetical protein TSAR_008112 [Trichomalopsis sarcophagae]